MNSMTSDAGHRTPGQLLEELIKARGWSQRTLAIIVGVDPAIIARIVAGKKAVSAEFAIAFDEVFGVPAERFMELQKTYELAQARLVSRPDPGRATRARLFGALPIGDMIKRGWLDADDPRNVPKVEAALTRFFGAPSVQEIEILPHAAKKTNVAESVTAIQLAWLYRVREITSEMIVPRYSASALRAALPALSELRVSAEAVRKVPRILGEAGVRFAIVEGLPGAKIDGVCFWLGEAMPVVAMTLRLDRIDNFWFVLRHELEHVLQGHGKEKVTVDAELEGERAGVGAGIPDDERIANEAAAEFCVSQSAMDRFIKRKEPFFAERDLLGFARTIGVHPGLVAGQLQHRTGRYDRFRTHQVKVRSHVAPSATVDGWGDIAPTG